MLKAIDTWKNALKPYQLTEGQKHAFLLQLLDENPRLLDVVFATINTKVHSFAPPLEGVAHVNQLIQARDDKKTNDCLISRLPEPTLTAKRAVIHWKALSTSTR